MKARDKEAVLERFWRNVTKTNSCWIWEGGVGSSGYGAVCFNSKTCSTHRFIYEALVAPIPDGMCLDHLCRNRRCVNPNHLEVVTLVENVMRGESPSAKNARKTHCKHGHEYTLSNTYNRPDGSRECMVCQKVNWTNGNRKRYAKIRNLTLTKA